MIGIWCYGGVVVLAAAVAVGWTIADAARLARDDAAREAQAAQFIALLRLNGVLR